MSAIKRVRKNDSGEWFASNSGESLHSDRNISSGFEFNELCDDLILQIMIQTVSSSPSSIHDLAKFKLTNKRLRSAADDEWVLRHIYLSQTNNWWFPLEYSDFLQTCLRAQNLHAYYLGGLVQYFNANNMELGCELLRKAVDGGHQDATYVFGLIQFNDNSTEIQGMKLLNKVENTDLCRQRVMNVLQHMFLNTILRRKVSRCPNLYCRNDGRLGARRNGEWSSWDNKSDQNSFCSPACKWVIETNRFCEVFPYI